MNAQQIRIDRTQIEPEESRLSFLQDAIAPSFSAFFFLFNCG